MDANDEDIPLTNVVPIGSIESDNRDGSNGSDRFWPIEEQTGDFCWLHVVVDTLEGLYAITHNRQRIKLSKQELVDNLYSGISKPKYDSKTNTYSISMEDAYNWIIDNGLSLEQDYGSGKYEATLQDPKERIPGCRIFNLTGVGRLYSNNDNEDRILEELDYSPGAGIIIMDSTQMDSLEKDADAVYSIAANAKEDRLHGVVVSGYDDTGSRNAYWVRDSLKSRAPNEGHYRVSRASGVQSGEKDPVVYVLFPYGVSLSESSTTINIL
ncbi:KDEL-tailed cysteine endopeptidase CEP3-like [Silene latifolia]|uniref:KDEL-tailed cysteine endopeptidase CEP3-like n=1 Tax=Silene latifolia TaxID=37657 RepID=UPI003D7808A3